MAGRTRSIRLLRLALELLPFHRSLTLQHATSLSLPVVVVATPVAAAQAVSFRYRRHDFRLAQCRLSSEMAVPVLRVAYQQERRQSLVVTSPLVALTLKVVRMPIKVARAAAATTRRFPALVCPVRGTPGGHPLQVTMEAVVAVQAQLVRLALVLPEVRAVRVLSRT